MKKSEVIALIKANKNSQTARKINTEGQLKTYDIGLTTLRKLAKQVGRDHDLALQLWNTDVYEARIIGLLIDDPKPITREQAEEQVDDLEQGALGHVFSSCDASLAKTPFVVELAEDWIKSKDKRRRKCGYGLLYEISKMKGKKAPDDAFFLKYVKMIGDNFKKNGSVEGAFSLLGIGKRNVKLNSAALKVAKQIGPIESDKENCDPFDLEDHLTKDHLKRRLGIK